MTPRLSDLFARWRASPFARGVALAVVIQGLGIVATYAAQVVLARLLGVQQYGQFAYLLAVVAVVAVAAELGWPLASVRFLSEFRAAGRWGEYRGVAVVAGTVVAGAGLLLALLLSIASPLSPWTWLRSSPEHYLLAAWIVPLWALANVLMGMLRANGRILWSLFPRQVLLPVLLVGGAGAWALLRGPVGTTDALVAAGIAVAAVVVVEAVAFATSMPAEVRAQPAVYRPRDWSRVSVTLMLDAALAILFSQASLLILRLVRGPAEAGLFSVAFQTALLVTLALIVVNHVAAPKLAKLKALGETEQLQRVVSQVAHWVFWPSLVAAAACWLLAPWIVRIFGDDFGGAALPLAILAAGQLVNASTGSVGNLMKLTGHQDAALVISAVSTVSCVVLSLVGSWALGAVGAALASGLAIAIKNLWMHRWAVQRVGVNPSIWHVLRQRGTAR